MSRNTNSRFALNPTNLDIGRSKFTRSSSVKTTFNAGDLVPFYVDEVLPGDTFQINTSKVVRMQTLITPLMDNLYLDTYYFFVPNRIVWDHWRELNGENTQSAWIPSVEYSVPQITAPEGGWSVGSIADYMGLPVGVEGISVNALPFRAYALICNEWFRDQNLTDPLDIPKDDSTVAGTNGTNYISDVAKGGAPFKVAKYHDYFTSCLPSPQKGPDVEILGAVGTSMFPVKAFESDFYTPNLMASGNSPVPIRMKFGNLGPQEGWLQIDNGSLGISGSSDTPAAAASPAPVNLYAVSENAQASTTINQLRLAFAIQKAYEKDARGGTRYIEILKAHFGVTSPDGRLQRPEYLGGNRIPIRINQVIQQSETGATSPLGNVAGMSYTTDRNDDFTRSFTEHGFIIGVMAVRYDHTYQQGIERFWSRKTRFDYYWPVFANLGEMAVLNKEIFAQGNSYDNGVFGYQEAWADYRYKPSRVTGEMRSDSVITLDSWHLADDYETLPSLSDSWIREDPAPVNRAIAISDQVADQFFADIYVQNISTRPMPMYSIPGLIDHH